MSRPAYLVDAIRTPFGRLGGSLSGVRADDLGALAIRALLDRTKLDPARVDDVIFGCANQAGEDNRNVARMCALLAGLPVSVPGVTVNRLCGSGMQAVADAARLVQTGEADLVIAGGVEHMTRAPFVMERPDRAFPRGPQTLHDTMLGWRLVNPMMTEMHETIGLGNTAERVAREKNVSREAQDRLALRSQQRAAAAQQSGRLAKEIVPVELPAKKGAPVTTFSHDEHARPDTTIEKLASLRPVFDPEGTVTAGNASGLNDGSAAILVASEDAMKEHGLSPMVRYVTSAVAGVPVSLMGLGPIPASQKALRRAKLTAKDIAFAELNEAFAAQAVPCIEELGLDPDIVNPNGGAIALGHPLGASGARLVGTLAHQLVLEKARHGLASMCIGVGQGIALVMERA